jgi:sugar-specific transcriptional regulator TrmB
MVIAMVEIKKEEEQKQLDEKVEEEQVEEVEKVDEEPQENDVENEEVSDEKPEVEKLLDKMQDLVSEIIDVVSELSNQIEGVEEVNETIEKSVRTAVREELKNAGIIVEKSAENDTEIKKSTDAVEVGEAPTVPVSKGMSDAPAETDKFENLIEKVLTSGLKLTDIKKELSKL